MVACGREKQQNPNNYSAIKEERTTFQPLNLKEMVCFSEVGLCLVLSSCWVFQGILFFWEPSISWNPQRAFRSVWYKSCFFLNVHVATQLMICVTSFFSSTDCDFDILVLSTVCKTPTSHRYFNLSFYTYCTSVNPRDQFFFLNLKLKIRFCWIDELTAGPNRAKARINCSLPKTTWSKK